MAAHFEDGPAARVGHFHVAEARIEEFSIADTELADRRIEVACLVEHKATEPGGFSTVCCQVLLQGLLVHAK